MKNSLTLTFLKNAFWDCVCSTKIWELRWCWPARDSLGQAEFGLKWKPMTHSKSPYASRWWSPEVLGSGWGGISVLTLILRFFTRFWLLSDMARFHKEGGIAGWITMLVEIFRVVGSPWGPQHQELIGFLGPPLRQLCPSRYLSLHRHYTYTYT